MPATRHRRAFATAALLLLPLAAVLLPAPAAAEVAPEASNLTGVWRDGFDYTFRILQVPGSSTLTTEVLEDLCTGGPRDYVITATIDGVSLNGTMQRCDDADHDLVVNCHLPSLWETPFSANVSGNTIVGIRRGEYYKWDFDENGTRTNCHIDHYTNNSFEFERLDCPVQTFEQLANHHISAEAERAEAVALAESFEGGQRLYWTEGQLAPGGLKSKIDTLKAGLEAFGYTVSVNSAYRPLLYQAHFADLRICALAMRDTLSGKPYLGPFFAESVASVNAEVYNHHIKGDTYQVAGLTLEVPFVCYKEPIINCPHVDERAADLSVNPNETRVDWIGSLFGMCRPYLFAKTPDPPHWEYRGPDVFADPKCSAAGRLGYVDLSISGNSPVNILLTDSAGSRIGYDPVAGEAVNDFGSSASYSGPGTQPQLIEVEGYDVIVGAYSVTGMGTGAGPYAINYSVTNDGGYVLDGGSVAGVASLNASTARLDFTVRDDYSAPPLWKAGTAGIPSGGRTPFSVSVGNRSETVTASGGTFGGLLFAEDEKVLALKDDGAGGATAITLPKGLMGGDFTVRLDGAQVTPTRTEDASGVTLTFDRPVGASFITVEGTQAGVPGAPTATAPGAGGDLLLFMIVGALAAVGVAAAIMMRRRTAPPAAPPPPGPGK